MTAPRQRILAQNFTEFQTIQFLHPDFKVQIFDDEAMRKSAEEISGVLEEIGALKFFPPRPDQKVRISAYEAYQRFCPMAFKADLWRYMMLWRHGGVYVDANLQL